MRIDDLDSPAVLVDLDRMERNLRGFQDYCRRHGRDNRPHIKTHKVAGFARLQLELGAVGLTCQKLGEAAAMADHGADDILIAYNILGTAKLRRAVALARRIRLRVTCDSEAVASGLSEAMAAAGLELGVLIECDTGAGRCGVQAPAAAGVLARAIDALPGLRFDGLMTYPLAGAQAAVGAFIDEAVAVCAAAGLEAAMVSSGGTPDMWSAHNVAPVTEHRAGTYIYHDRYMVDKRAAGWDDCALAIVATVVSRPTAARVILDAGSKTLSSDPMGLEGHARIVEYPEAHLTKLSEEHGHADFSASAARPAIGERLTLIPNHACAVSNLHDQIHGVRGGLVERSFDIVARGKVR